MGSEGGQFKAGDPRTREKARKGGSVTAEMRRKQREPYADAAIDVADTAGLTGESYALIRAILKAKDARPLSAAEVELIHRHAERPAPTAPVRVLVLACGRRGGKSRGGAVAAWHRAISFDPARLAPGETAVVMLLAADRRQARAVLGYLKAMAALPEFAPYVHRVLKESIELRTGVNIEVHTASYRLVRGYTVIGCVMDECAYWTTDEGGANPDTEVYSAVMPAMASVPDAQLLMLSNPYATKGLLWREYQRAFGKDDPFTLVLNADTRSLNPTIPAEIIAQAFEDDPVAAASEYGSDGRVAFRRDVEVFLSPEALAAVIVRDRHELPPREGVRYLAFVDPSGGAADSMTLAVAHIEKEVAVLDCLREVKPPFSPDSVVRDFAAVLRSYRLGTVTGDRYAGEWPRERFARHGIQYQVSERTKSDIYRELLPLVNSARVELLDNKVLRSQLIGLERRVARGGKDSIDHAPGGHDDVANAAAGALVLASPLPQGRYNLIVG
jgi:hypothetical protein